MFKVIASCFIESIGTNALLVQDIYKTCIYILVIIDDTIYCYNKYYTIEKNIEFIKAVMESGTVLIQPNKFSSAKLTYSMYLNDNEITLYTLLTKTKPIMLFVNENRDLFERDGRPILK